MRYVEVMPKGADESGGGRNSHIYVRTYMCAFSTNMIEGL